MAKFELRFIDVDFEERSVEVYKTPRNNQIVIKIYNEEENIEQTICLDKSTAIKFAKTLRTEINKITESEVSNG
jgi:hypothetical protein